MVMWNVCCVDDGLKLLCGVVMKLILCSVCDVVLSSDVLYLVGIMFDLLCMRIGLFSVLCSLCSVVLIVGWVWFSCSVVCVMLCLSSSVCNMCMS